MKRNHLERILGVLVLVALFACAPCVAHAFDVSGFVAKVPVTVSGYSGKSALTNFPVLVRLSTAIPGFTYSDFRGANGSDLRFADTNGVELAYEIDTWDTNGTSLVWVRIPALVSNTVINAYYGNAAPAAALSTTNVWENYIGVWHFGAVGTSGLARDSSSHGYDAHAVDATCSTGRTDGVLGGCVVCSTNMNKVNTKHAGFVVTDVIACQGLLTVSGWFRHRGSVNNGNYERLVVAKENATDDRFGFDIERAKTLTKLQIFGVASNRMETAVVPDDNKQVWNHYLVSYDGRTVTVYTNGAFSASGDVVAAPGNCPRGVAFGCNVATNQWSYQGDMDEIRLEPVAISADWAQAEYVTAAKDNFAVAGTVVLDGVRIATGGGNTRIVPNAWITNNIDAVTVAAGTVAISNALEAVGANGVPRWQSYALGLNPNSATSVILGDARQDAVVDAMTLFARNIAPVTNGTFSVRYVLEGSADGANWTDLGSSPSNALSIALPPAKPLFRVRAEIIQQ